MSDEDRDVDIESDDEGDVNSKHSGGQFQTQAEKRAHHNALERKRRDHIKDSFSSLRDSIPALQGEKVRMVLKASRAQILKKAADYIQFMRRKNSSHQQDIDDLRRQNSHLETQIRSLEKAKTMGTYAQTGVVDSASLITNPKGNAVSAFDGGSGSESSDSESSSQSRRKKLKTSSPNTSSS